MPYWAWMLCTLLHIHNPTWRCRLIRLVDRLDDGHAPSFMGTPPCCRRCGANLDTA